MNPVWRYCFPPNRRAAQATLKEQLLKVCEEAREAFQAYMDGESEDRIIEELCDVHQTVEGGMRKFPRRKVIKGYARVKLKSLHRGDYVRWSE